MPRDPNPFAALDALSLADLIERVRLDSEFSIQRRRNIASAMRSLCNAVSKRPSEVPAHATYVRPLIAKLHPEQCSLSASRIANIKSDLLFALKRYRDDLPRSSYMAPFSPAWQALMDLPCDRRSVYDKRSVARLARLASAQGIEPCEVGDTLSHQLLSALINESLLKNPRGTWKGVIRSWNRLSERVAGWPTQRLSKPNDSRAYTVPLDQFPASLRQEIDAAFDRWSGTNILDDRSPDKPLKPNTLKKRRTQLRELCSALVLSGMVIERITSLRVLVDPENAKTALRFFLDRADGKTNTRIHGLAVMIKTIARHVIGVSEDHQAKLHDLCRRLDPGPSGMTERNRDRLRPFDDRRNIDLIINLSAKVFSAVERKKQITRRDVLRVQWALAVELLTMAPMRRENLASLELDRHIIRSRASNGSVHIVIPPEEVKNNEPLDYPLPKETIVLLDLYLSKYRPFLANASTPFLFPGKFSERSKCGTTMGNQIRRFVERETGLKVNAHLFRHLIAKIYLDHNPGNYESVRRHLGHKRIDTTVRAYAGMETAAASRHVDETILKLRRPKKIADI